MAVSSVSGNCRYTSAKYWPMRPQPMMPTRSFLRPAACSGVERRLAVSPRAALRAASPHRKPRRFIVFLLSLENYTFALDPGEHLLVRRRPIVIPILSTVQDQLC